MCHYCALCGVTIEPVEPICYLEKTPYTKIVMHVSCATSKLRFNIQQGALCRICLSLHDVGVIRVNMRAIYAHWECVAEKVYDCRLKPCFETYHYFRDIGDDSGIDKLFPKTTYYSRKYRIHSLFEDLQNCDNIEWGRSYSIKNKTFYLPYVDYLPIVNYFRPAITEHIPLESFTNNIFARRVASRAKQFQVDSKEVFEEALRITDSFSNKKIKQEVPIEFIRKALFSNFTEIRRAAKKYLIRYEEL